MYTDNCNTENKLINALKRVRPNPVGGSHLVRKSRERASGRWYHLTPGIEQ